MRLPRESTSATRTLQSFPFGAPLCRRLHRSGGGRGYTRRVENAVETVGLRKVYGEGSTEVRALDDVSLEFPNGEFAAIMGPSGSGKSTLLHILGALDKPTGGKVVVGGTELSGLSDKELTILIQLPSPFRQKAAELITALQDVEGVIQFVLE